MQTRFARMGARWGLLAPDGQFFEVQPQPREAICLYNELRDDIIEFTMGDFKHLFRERARKLRDLSPQLFHELEREVARFLYPVDWMYHQVRIL